MTVRRLDAGPLLALLGATLLLVSLFLDWYDPGLTAWDVFEVLDLILAALAIAGVLAALAAIGLAVSAPDTSALPWIAGAALVLVAVTLLDRPPLVADGDPETGLWLALAGAALLAAGALLTLARVTLSFNVQARRTRVAAVDARAAHEPAAVEPEPPAPEPAASARAGAEPAVPDPAPADPAPPPRRVAAAKPPAAAPEPEPPAPEPEPPAPAPESEPWAESPVEPATPAGRDDTTRKLPDLNDPHEATGPRVEEEPRQRRPRRSS